MNDIDIKNVGLDILSTFHEYCVKNGLKYSLGYGTLLGAIRHNGFIPWDDDIDVIMPREDFNKFVDSYSSDRYEILTCKNNKKHYLPWGKFCDKTTLKIEQLPKQIGYQTGFNIDIFPFDTVNSFDEYKKLKEKEYPLLKKLTFSFSSENQTKTFKGFVKRLVKGYYAKRANKYANKVDDYFISNVKLNSDIYFYVRNEVFSYVKTHDYFFNPTFFDNLIEQKFENRVFLISSEYDDFLKKAYGDYKKLPPEKERVTHHSFKAYFLDD